MESTITSFRSLSMDDRPQKAQEELNTLRLHRGSPLARHRLRQRLRENPRFRREETPAGPYVRNERQVPYYVPPSDRASLSTVSQSTLTLKQGDAYCRQAEHTTKALRLPIFSKVPSLTSSLLSLPLELRHQIYSYLFPWNEHHMFQTSVHGKIPNFAVKATTQASDSDYYGPTYKRHHAYTAIMCVNIQLYNEVREYLFHDCIIRVNVDESGYSFLESHSGGPFPDARRRQNGTRRSPTLNDFLNYQSRDRFTDWHKSFMSNFDFTQPRKLMIRIQAPDYENPEGVVQIRESMMNLCDILRECPKIKAIEVEPQSQEYCCPDTAGGNDTHGSYFVWEWENNVLPVSQPCFGYELRKGFYRSKFDREAVWRGKLSHLLLQERSDLQLVLQPLQTLRNVFKPSIILPPTTADITFLQARMQGICRYMNSPRTGIRLIKMSAMLLVHRGITKECMFTSLPMLLLWALFLLEYP